VIRRKAPRARDFVNRRYRHRGVVNRQHLSRRIKIDASDVPWFADAERRFEKLVLHIPEPFAAKAECRTMPAFSLARLSGPAGAVKGSLRRASPALDCAARDALIQPQPTRISKEACFLARKPCVHVRLRRDVAFVS
jgi:hypothetical protein